jgi:hypothetical protein
MSCEGTALPFEAHANYGTWSIDFAPVYYLNSFMFNCKEIIELANSK